MDHRSLLAARAVGQYPLSIATSLVVEALANTYPDRPPEPGNPIAPYQAIWINLRTLFRNLLGSMDREAQKVIMNHHLAEAMLAEMHTLTDALVELQPHLKVMFYAMNFPNFARKFPHALLRVDHTAKQIEYNAMMVATVEQVLAQARQHFPKNVVTFGETLHTAQPLRSLLLTHYAYDLTSASHLGETDLIESHTGRIKPPSQWYTKYYQGKELSMMPFRLGLLPVFGDDTTFKPLAKPVRESVVEIATKYKWTSVTTKERIRLGIEQLKDPWARTVILDMLG